MSVHTASKQEQDLTEDPSETFSDVDIDITVTHASPESNDKISEQEGELDTTSSMSSRVRRERNTKIGLVVLVIGILVPTALVIGALFNKEDKNSNSTSEATTFPETMACTRDARICSDGTAVGRNGTNNCAFDPCPEGACFIELLIPCDDGVTKVCDQTQCPSNANDNANDNTNGEPTTTSQSSSTVTVEDLTDTLTTNSSNTDNNGGPDGQQKEDQTSPTETPQPAAVLCPRSIQLCSDGSFVSSDPDNNCEFPACPDPSPEESTETATPPPPTSEQEPSETPQVACPRQIKLCTDLTSVTYSGPNCELEECPQGACWVDSQVCPDGITYVGRDPFNNCEFSACPEGSTTEESTPEEEPSETPQCDRDIQFCPDGSFVVRDTRICEFPPCPP